MRRLARTGLLIVIGILAGCRREPPPHIDRRSLGPPRLTRISELNAAERMYGQSASRSDAVSYQPDVVFLPAGAGAIRAAGADGLTWTIDPDTDGVKDIQPGKVLLLTSQASGRVLAVERSSDGLRVVLGPVDLTEVIRDGHFTLDQPVDLAQTLSFAWPDVFDTPPPVGPVTARLMQPGSFSGFVRPAAFAPAGGPTVHQFTLTPFLDPKGVGVRIASNAGGVMFLGQAVLYLNAPTVHFVLDMSGAKVKTAEVQLSGIAGFLIEFDAAMPQPTDANINSRRFAAHDFAIPISGVGGLPLALHLRQQFLLKTAFTGTGTLKARGYYTLNGALRAGYRDGKFSVSGPGGFTTKETLLPSLAGVAMGPRGLAMTHHINVIVGIGAAGFVAGPYGFMNSSITATQGATIGLVLCRQESVMMAVGAGVGYQIPEPVTKAINAVLGALHIRERINGSGGIQSPPAVLASQGWYHSPIKACGP